MAWFSKKDTKEEIEAESFVVKEGLNNTYDITLKPEGVMKFFEWFQNSPNQIMVRINGSEYSFGERVDKLFFILGFDLAIQVFKDPDKNS
jgi:hypothetical protein